MYFEQYIIRNNTQIAFNEYSSNNNLALYFQSHRRNIAHSDEDIIINNLTAEEIKKIHSLCESKMEKEIFKNLQIDDSIDILMHYVITIK